MVFGLHAARLHVRLLCWLSPFSDLFETLAPAITGWGLSLANLLHIIWRWRQPCKSVEQRVNAIHVHKLVTEALCGCSPAAGLFGYFDLEHRQRGDGAHPLVNLLTSLRVSAAKLRKPRALRLDAVLLDERAESSLFELHGQFFEQMITSAYASCGMVCVWPLLLPVALMEIPVATD